MRKRYARMCAPRRTIIRCYNVNSSPRKRKDMLGAACIGNTVRVEASEIELHTVFR